MQQRKMPPIVRRYLHAWLAVLASLATGYGVAGGQFPTFTNMNLGSDRSFRANLLTEAGKNLTMEISTNLHQWEVLGFATSIDTDILEFADRNPIDHSAMRFYRAVTGVVDVAYVGGVTSDSLRVIDLSKKTVVKTIPISGGPIQIVVSPDRTRLYISVRNPLGVRVFDILTHQTVDFIPVDSGPVPSPYQRLTIQFAQDGKKLFAGTSVNFALQTFAVPQHTLESGSPFNEAHSFNWFHDVKLAADGNRVFMTGMDPQQRRTWIMETSTSRLLGVVPVGGQQLLVHPDGTRIYVVGGYAPYPVLDAQTLAEVDNIEDSEFSFTPSTYYMAATAISPDGNLLYFLDSANDELVVLATGDKKLVKRTPLAAHGDIQNLLGYSGMALSSNGDRLYVPTIDRLIVIETINHTVLDAIPTGFPQVIGNESRAVAVLKSL